MEATISGAVSDLVVEQAKLFIKNNGGGKLPVGYLIHLSKNGIVEHGDLVCDKERFGELNKSAIELGLHPKNGFASELMKRDLASFIETLRPMHEVHVKADKFTGKESTTLTQNYLAILAIKGEVKSSDLKPIDAFHFMELNSQAMKLGLIYPGYLPNNKVEVSKQTQEALKTYFLEFNLAEEHNEADRKVLKSIYDTEKSKIIEKEKLVEVMTQKDRQKSTAGVRVR